MPTPVSHRQLAAAAELRAAGNSWEAVAARVGRSAETVRRWPRRYKSAWAAALIAAERRRDGEARAEAIGLLRQQLRSDDIKTQRDAARALLSIRPISSDAANSESSIHEDIYELARELTANDPGEADRESAN